MAVYGQTQRGNIGTRVNWNGDFFRRIGAKVKGFWAPEREVGGYYVQVDHERGYDFWMDAIHAPDHLSPYR